MAKQLDHGGNKHARVSLVLLSTDGDVLVTGLNERIHFVVLHVVDDRHDGQALLLKFQQVGLVFFEAVWMVLPAFPWVTPFKPVSDRGPSRRRRSRWQS